MYNQNQSSATAVMEVNIQTRSEKIFHFMVKMIIYGLKSIGLAPISLHTETPAENSCDTSHKSFMFSKVGLFYNIVLLILIPIMAELGFANMLLQDAIDETFFSQILEVILYVSCVFISWFVILYWVLSQKKAVRIMNRLLHVRCLLSTPKDQLYKKWMLIFLALHMMFNVFLWIILLVTGMIDVNSFVITITYNMPQLVIYWLFIEYSMVLRLVIRELENLNNNLLTIKEFSNYSFHTYLTLNDYPAISNLPAGNKLEAIKLLHNVRITLSEVSQDIADFFSLPILLCIACNFLALVINVYYIVIPAFVPFYDRSLMSYIFSALWFLICIYPLISLAFSVTKTKKKAKLTRQLVHKLLATAKKREIIAELEQFALQLIHEKLSFTAYGFFELDFTLLQSIVGATATYLIIVIQFVQSEKP